MSHDVGKEIGRLTGEWAEEAACWRLGLVVCTSLAAPMTDRPRSSSSGLRLLVRLLSVVAMLTVLCVSGRAGATPLTGTVPMCGEHNESIAAPPIFRALDDASVSGLPCQSPGEFAIGQSAPAAPERVIVYERPERVLGSAALHIAPGAASRMPIQRALSSSPRPGFRASPFRPPRP